MSNSRKRAFEDNFIVAGARVCAENTANMNNIMEACSIMEFCYLGLITCPHMFLLLQEGEYIFLKRTAL